MLMLLFADSGGSFAIFILARVMVLAIDNGATIAIILALITLLGTVSAQVVTWHKIRTDSETANRQMIMEQRRSDVEIAQNVMSQTVIVLNDRLKNEAEAHESRIQMLSKDHDRQIANLKVEHKRDVDRLERKIDRLQKDWAQCKVRNQELTEELAALKQRRTRGEE